MAGIVLLRRVGLVWHSWALLLLFVSPAVGQTLNVTPTSLNYGTRLLGTVSSAQKVTLANVGNVPVLISGITTSGDFAQTNNCGSSIAVGGNCIVSVKFAPTAIGSRTGNLTITDNASNSPQQVSLKGTGTVVSLSTKALTFPATLVGSSSAPQTVTLTNIGTTTVTIKKVVTGGTNSGDFVPNNGCGTSVAAGASCPISATFKPTATGTRSATLSIYDDGGASPQNVTLTGTGSSIALVSIAVIPGAPSIALGTSLGFSATATFSDGSTQNVTSSVTWTSSNTSVATISNSSGAQGIATSSHTGTTIISASSGSISGSTTLTVTSAALVSIAVSPANQSLSLGLAQQFSATGTFTDGSMQDITTSVAWSSSDISVATISNSSGTQGLATSVNTGSTSITAALNSKTGAATLTVTSTALVSITITPGNPFLPPNTDQQFIATGTFTDNSTKDLTKSATWSSSDTTIATVGNRGNDSGDVTTIASGTASITATSGSVTGSTILTVTTASLVSLAIAPGSASIPSGTNQQFTATGTFDDSSTQDMTGTVYWTSSPSTVATISDSPPTSGLANSTGIGNATIAASSGSITATAALTVTAPQLSSISVSPANPSIAIGLTQQFHAVGTFTDGTKQDLTSSVSWTSSNVSIATISNDSGTTGLATAVAAGTTVITATMASVTGSTALTVTATGLTSIAVTPADTSIALGQTQQLIASGTFSDNTTQDLTTSVTWVSSAPGVASVSNSSGTQGLATSTGSGTTTISATSGSISGSTTLSVAPPVLTGVAITPTNPSILLGNGQQLTATGYFSDGSTQDLTSSVTWTVSAPSIATVSNSGMLSSLAAGTANIVATSGSFSDTTIATVISAVPGTVVVRPLSACTGVVQTYQFTATVTSTSNNAVTWYVDGIAGGSNTVGTIASTGLYTAPVSTGTHTIKAVNVNDSTKSATATISVISAVKVTLNTLTAAVLAGNRQQFSATVCGSSNQVLNWSSSGGTVTSTGLFTAPSVEGTYTVTATSAADSSKSASAAVSVFSNVSADFGGRAGGVVIPANLFSAQYVERLPLTVQEMFENAGFSGGRTYAKVQNVYATATPDWTKIDGIISKYQTVGISPIIEMAYAPSWLLPSNPCSVNTAPTDVNQWAQLAASYVAHFDQKFPGLITEYEIWNEPSHNFCNLANKLNTYLSLYAAAGAAMRAQANADGTTIHIGGPVSFGESAWISALLTNSSTAPYVDFISYHQYSFSPADINAGLNWDSSTDTAPLYARTQDPSTGYAALFKSVVAAEGNAKLPVYITEYNDSASFGATCCRNSATFAPVWNALVVADLLNIAYSGTQQLPSRLSYYAAAGGTSTIGYFCLYGTYDSTMDCSVTSGYSAYPQTYAYILLSSSAYLGLSSGGHMALSVAPATTQIGPVATAFYNNTQNAIVIVNPTATNYPSLNVVFKNPGTTASSGTYYLLNSSNSQITSQQISLSPVASGYSTTIVLPRYSVVAVSIGAP